MSRFSSYCRLYIHTLYWKCYSPSMIVQSFCVLYLMLLGLLPANVYYGIISFNGILLYTCFLSRVKHSSNVQWILIQVLLANMHCHSFTYFISSLSWNSLSSSNNNNSILRSSLATPLLQVARRRGGARLIKKQWGISHYYNFVYKQAVLHK